MERLFVSISPLLYSISCQGSVLIFENLILKDFFEGIIIMDIIMEELSAQFG